MMSHETTAIVSTRLLVLVLVVLGIAGLFIGTTTPVVAQDDPPGDPVVFYGTIETTDGTPTPAGSTVVMSVDDTPADTTTVDDPGIYAESAPDTPKLETHTNAGTNITFHLETEDGDRVQAAEHVSIPETGAGVHNLNLTVPTEAIDNPTPTAAMDITPSSPTTQDTVTLSAAPSTAPDNREITTYTWTITHTDTDTDDSETRHGEHLTTTFDPDGTYSINLHVTDDAGATDTTTRQVTVGTPPQTEPTPTPTPTATPDTDPDPSPPPSGGGGGGSGGTGTDGSNVGNDDGASDTDSADDTGTNSTDDMNRTPPASENTTNPTANVTVPIDDTAPNSSGTTVNTPGETTPKTSTSPTDASQTTPFEQLLDNFLVLGLLALVAAGGYTITRRTS